MITKLEIFQFPGLLVSSVCLFFKRNTYRYVELVLAESAVVIHDPLTFSCLTGLQVKLKGNYHQVKILLTLQKE